MAPLTLSPSHLLLLSHRSIIHLFWNEEARSLLVLSSAEFAYERHIQRKQQVGTERHRESIDYRLLAVGSKRRRCRLRAGRGKPIEPFGSPRAGCDREAHGCVNKQVSAGSAFLEEASESLRAAAAKLDERLSPLAHGLRRAARAGDDFAEQVRTRSPGELLNASSEYARQRPMLVFGVAAGVGLLLSRFAKSTRPTSASPTSDWGQTRAQSAQMSLQTRGGATAEHQFPDALMPDWTS